jgi:hypothetical protein
MAASAARIGGDAELLGRSGIEESRRQLTSCKIHFCHFDASTSSKAVPKKKKFPTSLMLGGAYTERRREVGGGRRRQDLGKDVERSGTNLDESKFRGFIWMLR